jgi:hypothetical protein
MEDMLEGGRPITPASSREAIPWERPDLPWYQRFWRTLVEVLLKPGATLGRIGEGGAIRPVVFLVTAALTSVLLFACQLGVGLAMRPEVAQDSSVGEMLWLFGYLIVCNAAAAPFVLAGFALVMGGCLHVAAKALGGRGTLPATLRASAYMGAVWPLLATLQVLTQLPMVGVVFLIVFFGVLLFWPTVALFQVAKGVHGLSRARAAVPALIPLLAFLGFTLVVDALVPPEVVEALAEEYAAHEGGP